MVLAFARELADAMGTELVHQGRVTRLVAKDWYDDGPIDLTGRFAKLERGGELEERLRVIAPLALRSLLDDVLGQGFVDARSFPLVATLVRNLGRDDLLPPLLEVATTIADLDRFTRESLLTAAWDAGATQEARRFYERHLRGSLRRHGVPTLFTTPRVLAEMGEASFALRLLRRSRPRGVEKDEEEMDADRLLAAAFAHLELRRHNKAQTLLTRAVTRFSRDPRVARWRRMLADLSMTTEA